MAQKFRFWLLRPKIFSDQVMDANYMHEKPALLQITNLFTCLQNCQATQVRDSSSNSLIRTFYMHLKAPSAEAGKKTIEESDISLTS